jgi:PAS domain S-box-containing protein
MMGVEQYADRFDAPAILAALLDEFSAVTDYRTLRDNLPRRLTSLLKCRCILIYQRIGETLQFASGSFADQPGWSSTLLAVAHINPIELHSDTPETQSWCARRAVLASLASVEHALICTPLLYRQRAIGVLAAIRGVPDVPPFGANELLAWTPEEVPLVAVAANVVAMLLENTRLLERDRERIHELSLLNSITSQMNSSLRERDRVERIVIQRTREIASADLCEVLMPSDVPADRATWIPPDLHQQLFRHWQDNLHQNLHRPPLVLERMGDAQANDYFRYLSPRIKTFFALPLLSNRAGTHVRGSLAPYVPRGGEAPHNSVLGIIVGASYQPRKLRREELVLLQVLANQTSAALENIVLMEDVLEARNEARHLLRQVLDDQRLQELILESIPSGLMTLDMQGQITSFNRAAGAILGYHAVEVIGQPVLKILGLRGLEDVFQSAQPRHETLLTSGRQGQEVALDLTLAPLLDDQGHQMGILTTFADVTSVYHLEEEKRRLDRLASLGEMSASVAHEVRNPLASIKTSMQMLLDDLESSAEPRVDTGIREAVTVVLQEVERLDCIVRDLLLFARPRQLHLVECDLAELCGQLLRFLQPQCAERGVRVTQVYQDLSLAQVDLAQIKQVLMNLFLNALQAMPEGGVLSIASQLIHLPALETGRSNPYPPGRKLATLPQPVFSESTVDEAGQKIAVETRGLQKSQLWLELAVSDTGGGIAQDDLARIFQPFHTTKAHGIGLGLPITRRLIEDHHGQLLVESQLGYGTTMLVRLPLFGRQEGV